MTTDPVSRPVPRLLPAPLDPPTATEDPGDRLDRGGGRRPSGAGSIQQRRPGVYEVRLRSSGVGGSRQHSLSVHGTRADAEAELHRMLSLAQSRPQVPPPAALTVAELLELWLAADHPWKPSTWVGYRSTARALAAHPFGTVRAQLLDPATMRSVLADWQEAGAGPTVVAGRFRTLRAALSWAYDERLIDFHPIRHMHGPGRTPPRRPLTDDELARLLVTAETLLLEALANSDLPARRHRRELDLLLVRLAADTGARRGELATLRRADRTGRVLHIERAESAGQLTVPKSGHGRTLTLGQGTTQLWATLEQGWQTNADRAGTELGPWVFTADLLHHHHLGAGALGHRFAALRDTATVPHATLHRLRHQVASSPGARSSRPKHAWATPTPPPPCASTPTPCP